MLKTFNEFNKTSTPYYDQIVDYFKANVIDSIETNPIGLDTDKVSIETKSDKVSIEESDEGESSTAITGVDNIAIPEAPFSNINIIKRRHNNKRKRL